MRDSRDFAASEMDNAIDAYRADPTEENRARLMAAQEAHVNNFYRARATEYVARCR